MELSQKLAATEILLSFRSRYRFPISGFPNSLLQDEEAKQNEGLQLLRHLGPNKRFNAHLPAETRRNSFEGSNSWTDRSPVSSCAAITRLLSTLLSPLSLQNQQRAIKIIILSSAGRINSTAIQIGVYSERYSNV